MQGGICQFCVESLDLSHSVLRVLLNGLDITDRVAEGSLRIEDRINKRTIAKLSFYSDGPSEVQVGNPLVIISNGIVVFSGYIVPELSAKVISYASGKIKYTVTAADYHQLTDHLSISKSYIGVEVADIVEDIVENYLAAEGITAGEIIGDKYVSEAVFNFATITEVLDELAARTDNVWYVDFYKKLFFVPRNMYTAPWTITMSDILADFSIVYGNNRYRNKQIIRNARDVTAVQTEMFRGDGAAKTFVVAYPIAMSPSVYVNDVAKTVGIRELDTGKDWYWNKDSNEIKQDDAATPLSASDILRVEYRGFVDIVVCTWDSAEIEKQRQRMGEGSGVVENVAESIRYTESGSYIEYANSLLLKYCRDAKKLVFTTRKPGLEAGQLVRVQLPFLGIDEDMLVEEVNIAQKTVTENGMTNQLLLYTVTLVYGPIGESWTSFFKSITEKGRVLSFNINATSVNISVIFKNYTDNIAITEAVAETCWACPIVQSVDNSQKVIVYAAGHPSARVVC